MARVITVLNQKGGVGKSTLTVNLAAIVAEKLNPNPAPGVDSPVAIVSVDPQGTALWWTKRLENPNYQVYQWDAAYDTLTELRNLKQAEGIDYFFVDTPGWFDFFPEDGRSDGLGDGRAAQAIRAVLDATDEVIVPLKPEILELDPTVRAIEKLLIPRGLAFTVVVNGWNAGEGDTWLNQTREALLERRFRLADTSIRRYTAHRNAALHRWTAVDYAKSLTEAQRAQTDESKKHPTLKAAEDFYTLAEELTGLGISIQSDLVEAGV